MALDSWYYKQSDETCGPITFEELFAMAHEGKLNPQMDVKNGESGNWFPAQEIGGLFDADSDNSSAPIDEMPSLDEFSIVDSSFGVKAVEDLPSMDGFSIIEEEDKLSSELEAQLPRFATLEAVRSKHQNIQWFCQILNQELGPMSADDLMQLLLDGELAPNDNVKSSAEPEWIPARTVVFLSSSANDLDVLDSEEEESESTVDASADAVVEEQVAEISSEPTATKEPPKPPILKVRSRQKWFCKLGGMGYGPIEAHKIKLWAEQARIESTDLVKLGRKGEWFEAWQIEALQFKKPAETETETTDASEEPQEHESKMAAEPVKEVAAPVAPLAMPASPSIPPPVTPPTPARPKPQIKVARSNPLDALGPLMKPEILGGAAAVIALAALFYFVPLGGLFGPGGHAELEKFQVVYKELLALQQKNASESEYTSFKTKTKTELGPILEELEVNASSDRPHLQHLLWAGRDYLYPMIDNAHKGENRDQEKFEKHLKESERILNK